jgi:hypothetical protein
MPSAYRAALYRHGPIAFFYPSYCKRPIILRVRMVDYHNPVTITRDFGAYTFPSGSEGYGPIYQSIF